MRLIPSVAEATAPLSKRGAKRTPHLSQGPVPGLLGGPCFPRWGKWPKADRGAFRFASPFRSCRRGALRFASPLRLPARYGLGFLAHSANGHKCSFHCRGRRPRRPAPRRPVSIDRKRAVPFVGAGLAPARAIWSWLSGPFGECEETGILSLCLSKEKEPKRNDPREGKIAISSPPETHPNSNAQEGRSPLGTPPGDTDSPGGSASPRFPRQASVPPPQGEVSAQQTVGALPRRARTSPAPTRGRNGFRFSVGADALGGPWTCAHYGYVVGATLVVARRGTVLISGSLRRIRRETDILSLCLSKEKEPKRNDTREGKIAISSPPETHPNGNAQEGRSPLGSPPGGTDSPNGSVSFRFPRRATTRVAPTGCLLPRADGLRARVGP